MFRYWALFTLTCIGLLFAIPARAQQSAATLTGTVTDASTKKPVADVVITVTSPALQGEQVMVTDSSGFYRIPDLPSGDYTLHADKEAYRAYARGGITLRADSTIRVNVEVLPDAVKAEEVVVVARAPTVDVGSSSTGTNITSDFTERVPVSAPGSKGSGSRSFEAVAGSAPGATPDAYGVSISGGSSLENSYVIDGLSVSNPGFGFVGTPLSTEFVGEVNVITGGYMPEYGRATGGIMNVVTQSGSNEFHGSVFSYFAPGALEGPRAHVQREGVTVQLQPSLSYVGDIGFDLGGPIIKDKLWFYAGLDYSRSRYNIQRSLNRIQTDAAGEPIKDSLGFTQTELLPGTTTNRAANLAALQAILKLTWAVNAHNRLTLTTLAAPTRSGGNRNYSLDPRTGQPEISTDSIAGDFGALAHQRESEAYDASLKWSADLENKTLLFDTTLGYHHETNDVLPVDGSLPGSGQGLSNVSQVDWLRSTNPGPHSITDFQTLPNPALCNAQAGASITTRCPVTEYLTGGPGPDMDLQSFDRYQLGSVVTYLFQAAGHHIVKVGASAELTTYKHTKGDSGGVAYQESSDGTEIDDLWQFGALVGPDTPQYLDPFTAKSKSVIAGGFIQDSWSVLDKVTVNLGLRYDAQFLYGQDGQLGISLPNEWSPRAGVIYDPTQTGHSKIFLNYARYYESVPLDLADASVIGEPYIYSNHPASGCDPRVLAQQSGACRQDANRLNANAASDPGNPNRKWGGFGAGATPVDPGLKPQSSDELSAGGEYELFPDGRFGATYTKRWLNSIVEDMSRDNAQTFFIGNPGYGIAKDFPKATRNYDALTLYFMKAFRDDWLAQVSYTLSSLRGNAAGLFRAEDAVIQTNHTSDFDTKTIQINRGGPLNGDNRHFIKAFAAKDWPINPQHRVSTGLALRGNSGGPTSYLGAYPGYGPGQTYVLPRGEGERLPWEFSTDLQLGYRYNFDAKKALTFTVDVFNLFNFQAATNRDQNYTTSEVYGVPKGQLGNVKHADGTPLTAAEINPNFGNATAYQAPRIFRFGVRGSF